MMNPLFAQNRIKLNRAILSLFATKEGYYGAKISAGFFGVLSVIFFMTMVTTWKNDIHLAFKSEPATMLPLLSSENEWVQTISAAHLFGFDLPASALSSPITSAGLRLTGIVNMDADEASLSKAIISMNGGIGKVYQAGDALPDGMKVAAILADEVILDNGGQTERLPILRPPFKEYK